METLQRTANRGSVSTAPYEVDNSLKFEADNTEYLSFANSVGENRRTWTYSTWVKKTELFGAGSVGGTLFGAYLDSNDRARIEQYGDELGLHGKISGTTAVNVRTTMALRDTASWYHCMVVLDTTQATESNRVKIYVNGVQHTSMIVATYPPQNYQFAINNAVNHFVGQKGDNTDYFCGYMAETYFIDGQALTPTSFGEFDEDSGIWKPIEFTGTYPSADTNHFYLNFDDSSNLGKDSSGNGKNMTSNNITSADQATDTPTNNFAINNIVDGGSYTSDNVSYKEGGTVQIRNQNTNYNYNFSTLGMTKGKWYAEFQRGSATNIMIGVQLQNFDSTLSSRVNTYIGMGADNHGGAFAATGHYYYNNGATSEGTTYSDSEILGVAVDCDNDKIYFSVDGTYVNSANPASGSNGFDFGPLETNEPCFFVMNSRDPNKEHKANFGGYTTISISSAASDADGYGTFEYAPPSGYYALCTKNLEEYG